MSRDDWYCQDVLSGDKEVEVIWEDSRVMAFQHPCADPEADSHAVVIPKKHVASALSPESLRETRIEPSRPKDTTTRCRARITFTNPCAS